MEFLLRHGQFIAQLVLDALAGEQAAIRFISGIHTRHPLVLLETIREAQQEGSVLMGDPMNILIYLVCCGEPLYPFRTAPSARPQSSSARSRLAGFYPQ